MTVAETAFPPLPSRMLVAGDWVDTGSAGTLEPFNPSTGKVAGWLPYAGAEELDRAVDGARTAFVTWRTTPPAERRRVLQRVAELMTTHIDELALLVTRETGVPISQTPWMVQYGIDWLEDAAGWPEKLLGEVAPGGQGNLTYSVHEPYGVVASIATWNGSVGGFAMCVAPVLAAGCSVVVKPSELAPFGALRMAEIFTEAGLPPGVLSVLVGGAELGDRLVRHPGIDKVAFTGGGKAASAIARACADSLVPCLFELGGKSASLVFDDADVDRAVAAAMHLTFNAGQTCTVGTRLLVQNGVYDEFVDKLGQAMAATAVGDPLAADTAMGPLISARSLARTLEMIGRAAGDARLVTGGEAVSDGPGGFFMRPTLLADVSNTSELARTEVFGPVGAVIPFGDEAEAIAIANDTEYGLAAYAYTSDLTRALRVASALDAGGVGVNGGTVPAGPSMPFGGRRRSGYGRQGGRAGVMEYINTKTVNISG
ncbi:aldehyde dehydrogenase family protein [Pseudonocardia ailaonensis]|uniref:Aldehyde dehydrogenase family protein n=1 Tax=Pseudonocardia ailaonensis TaxID=367279 RepID=A0ABN2NB02_9PSEU